MEPTYEDKGYKWFYNHGTGLGEIQVDAGMLTDRPVCLVMQGAEAKAFNEADPKNHGPMIEHQWKVYQAKLAGGRR